VEVYITSREITQVIKIKKAENNSIGFVPTMGALHKGHLTLMEEALRNNDYVVVSVFVNPTQFNNPEDLNKYPRNLDRDISLLKTLSNSNIILFAPTVKAIYNDKIETESFDFDGLEHEMEGKFRVGHFDGVGTVVKRLLQLIEPNKAYFGEKDFQQLQIIRALNSQLDLQIEIIGCPIIREDDGLAMSSRNSLLSPAQRKSVPIIFKTLQEIIAHQKEWNISKMETYFRRSIEKESQLKVEYFFVAKTSNLIPVKQIEKEKFHRIFVAVFAGKTRLIDTVELGIL